MRTSPATQDSEPRTRDQAPLPRQNAWGFYEIRMESIGGLGAHLAGQILGEAAVLGMGLNGAHFSSYGSEKRGTPVKSYVRLCEPERELRVSSPVERPHLLAIFHDTLLAAPSTRQGLERGCTVVVNTRRSMSELIGTLDLPQGTTLARIDALGIALQEGSRINTAMLGAMVRAASFPDASAVKETIGRVLGARRRDLLEANLRTFDRGFAEAEIIVVELSVDEPAPRRAPPRLGYANTPRGGLLYAPGNSIHRDNSVFREGRIPELLPEKCTHCGLCDMVCPDYCFVWEEGADKRGRPAMLLRGIDYQYCKGCMTCIAVCPPKALVERPEDEAFVRAYRVPLIKYMGDS